MNMNIRQLDGTQVVAQRARPHAHGTVTRRTFLKAGATAVALGVGADLWHPDAAAASRTASADPRPIPYGTEFLGPGGPLFHVQAPGYPLPNPPFDTDPATTDPATITDFNGFVGLAYVGGQGTHRDLATGATASMYWEVDMRFMVGEYVGTDGFRHHGTFGFV